jgi:hypothetical protein
MLRGENRAHGIPIHEEEKKVQNKNLHNYSKKHDEVERVPRIETCLWCT